MKPLVLVHGFMGGSAQWRLQAPLSDERELICLDLPGFGQNAQMDPIDSIGEFAAWVLETLSERSVEEFDLLGHSMGGMIVQDIVRQAPDRTGRLILYGTGAKGVLPGRFETIETSMARARTEGALATTRRISATWFLDRESAESYSECADIAAQSTLPAILAGLEAMRDWSGEEHLASIRADTLVIWGDQDRTYAWPMIEQLWVSIKNSNLAVVPGSAHAVHAERAQVFNLLINEFLGDT